MRTLSSAPPPGSEAAWALQMQACEEEAERIFQELLEGYDGAATPVRPVNPQNPPRVKDVVDPQGRIYSTGRRKTASARVWIMPGSVQRFCYDRGCMWRPCSHLCSPLCCRRAASP
jgi:hypothetical protein